MKLNLFLAGVNAAFIPVDFVQGCYLLAVVNLLCAVTCLLAVYALRRP